MFQQHARHLRNYVDFATAARHIVEEVASGELTWKVQQQHFRLAQREQRIIAEAQAASVAEGS
eukprot:7215139-Karenia_brevis.AAC.1